MPETKKKSCNKTYKVGVTTTNYESDESNNSYIKKRSRPLTSKDLSNMTRHDKLNLILTQEEQDYFIDKCFKLCEELFITI